MTLYTTKQNATINMFGRFSNIHVLYMVLIAQGTKCDEETELLLLHVIFRHGQRTPADTYPLDPYVNFSFYPVGWGELTNEGKLQQYQQGQFLKKRYGFFLGNIYSPEIAVFYSTDVDRAKMSAQLEAAGLWPPVGEQLWNPQLLWQPIPVHSEPLSQDKLLLVRIPCPKYYMEKQKVMISSEVQNYLMENNATEHYQFLTNKTGQLIAEPDDVQSLYNTLKAEKGFNLTLPDWTENVYPDKLWNITVYSFILNAYNTQLQRIKGGPLLKKIIEDSLLKINNIRKSANRKLYAYSGHDSTISNFLMALNVWYPQEPVYNIMVLVEIHRSLDGRRHGIKLFLRNTTEEEPYPLNIPQCGHFCPLEDFLMLTKNVVPENLEDECKVNISGYQRQTLPPP